MSSSLPDKVVGELTEAIASIRGRPDYTKTQILVGVSEKSLTQIVTDLGNARQALLLAMQSNTGLSNQILSSTNDDLEALINSDLTMKNAGPLNTASTLSIKEADAELAIIEPLQRDWNDLSVWSSAQQTEVSPTPPGDGSADKNSTPPPSGQPSGSALLTAEVTEAFSTTNNSASASLPGLNTL